MRGACRGFLVSSSLSSGASHGVVRGSPLSRPAFDFFLSLEDQNQNFGDCMIERAGDLASDVDGFIESLREGPVLHGRNVMLASDLPDLQSQKVKALGHNDGSGHTDFKLQGDRIV